MCKKAFNTGTSVFYCYLKMNKASIKDCLKIMKIHPQRTECTTIHNITQENPKNTTNIFNT